MLLMAHVIKSDALEAHKLICSGINQVLLGPAFRPICSQILEFKGIRFQVIQLVFGRLFHYLKPLEPVLKQTQIVRPPVS